MRHLHFSGKNGHSRRHSTTGFSENVEVVEKNNQKIKKSFIILRSGDGLPPSIKTIGSLSNDVYERRTSIGSGPFSSLDDGFAQIFNQIVSIRVKKLSNTNFISSRHIKREKSSLPVDVRRSKTSFLKLPNSANVSG